MAADVRTWCTHCGEHVAYEYHRQDESLCPVCRDGVLEPTATVAPATPHHLYGQSNLVRKDR